MTWDVHLGDCVELMRSMPDAGVDAVVTDPPYGLEFMGKDWDSLRSTEGRDELKPSDEHRFAKGMKLTGGGRPTNRIASPNYAPKKNPRCKRCQRLKFDHQPRRCACDQPDWDTRTAEYAREMQTWHQAWATEALRVLKPGGHLLAFGGSRTSHRLACAIEDAGFEIRDRILTINGGGDAVESLGPEVDWVYGSG